MASHPWLRPPSTTRDEAERQLRKLGNAPGYFLIRQRADPTRLYAISQLNQDPQQPGMVVVRHFAVDKLPTGRLTVGENDTFATIQELVDHYRGVPLPGGVRFRGYEPRRPPLQPPPPLSSRRSQSFGDPLPRNGHAVLAASVDTKESRSVSFTMGVPATEARQPALPPRPADPSAPSLPRAPPLPRSRSVDVVTDDATYACMDDANTPATVGASHHHPGMHAAPPPAPHNATHQPQPPPHPHHRPPP